MYMLILVCYNILLSQVSADTADHAGSNYRSRMCSDRKYGTPSTVEIPDAVYEHLQYFDAVFWRTTERLHIQILIERIPQDGIPGILRTALLSVKDAWRTTGVYKEQDGQSCMKSEDSWDCQENILQTCVPNAKAGKPSCHTCGAACGSAELPARRKCRCGSCGFYHKESYGSAGSVTYPKGSTSMGSDIRNLRTAMNEQDISKQWKLSWNR